MQEWVYLPYLIATVFVYATHSPFTPTGINWRKWAEFAGRLYVKCASYMAGDMYKKVVVGKGYLVVSYQTSRKVGSCR
jgi:hypothetical protein